jgi:hypothetical protein
MEFVLDLPHRHFGVATRLGVSFGPVVLGRSTALGGAIGGSRFGLALILAPMFMR